MQGTICSRPHPKAWARPIPLVKAGTKLIAISNTELALDLGLTQSHWMLVFVLKPQDFYVVDLQMLG